MQPQLADEIDDRRQMMLDMGKRSMKSRTGISPAARWLPRVIVNQLPPWKKRRPSWPIRPWPLFLKALFNLKGPWFGWTCLNVSIE